MMLQCSDLHRGVPTEWCQGLAKCHGRAADCACCFECLWICEGGVADRTLRRRHFRMAAEVDDRGKLVSPWANCTLAIRETPESQCTHLPRAEYVNPSSRDIAKKALPNGELSLELKQAVSGQGVYTPLLKAMLSGGKFGDCVVIVDDTGYDAWPAKSVLELHTAPPATPALPMLGVVTNTWLGGKESAAATAKYCEAEIKGALRQLAARGCLKGYTKLPALAPCGPCPELDAAKLKRCVPSGETGAPLLLIKEGEISKFLACPVVGDLSKAWLATFNQQFNPSGRLHSEAINKKSGCVFPQQDWRILRRPTGCLEVGQALRCGLGPCVFVHAEFATVCGSLPAHG